MQEESRQKNVLGRDSFTRICQLLRQNQISCLEVLVFLTLGFIDLTVTFMEGCFSLSSFARW